MWADQHVNIRFSQFYLNVFRNSICLIDVKYWRYSSKFIKRDLLVSEARIGRLCSNETYKVNETGSPFYLQSPGYPSSTNTTRIAACTCHVEATATINIYILDLRLYGQTLSISDSYTSDVYTTANATIFNVTTINKSDESWITLENISYEDESYVWIGFEGNTPKKSRVMHILTPTKTRNNKTSSVLCSLSMFKGSLDWIYAFQLLFRSS